MIKKILILLTMLFLLFGNAYAYDVNLAFDYNITASNDQCRVLGSASNSEVTVQVGTYGYIGVTNNSDPTDFCVIKNVCYETIYSIDWINEEFAAYSDNYKLTSNDGYIWNVVYDKDDPVHISYGEAQNNTNKFLTSEFYEPKISFDDNLSLTNDNISGERKSEKIFYTGVEYVKVEDSLSAQNDDRAIKIYRSGDCVNWEYVNDVSDVDLFKFSGRNRDELQLEILNTGKEYLVRSSRFDNYSPEYVKNVYGIKDDGEYYEPLYMFDLNFEMLQQIKLDAYILGFSYVDGKYYATTSKNITYVSSDLEIWNVVGNNIAAPIQNNTSKIYRARIPLMNPSEDTNYAYCYGGAILYDNGEPSSYVITQYTEPCDIRAYGNIFAAYDNNAVPNRLRLPDNEIVDNNGTPLNLRKIHDKTQIMFSRDGIYWAVQELPIGTVQSIYQMPGYLCVDAGYVEYKFNLSDIEQIVPKGDIYVKLNDRILGFSQPPVMESDRILVPMRFLFEQMGAEVNWNDENQTATASCPASRLVLPQAAKAALLPADTPLSHKGTPLREPYETESDLGENTVTFSIDNTVAYVNGAETPMDVPARLINDQTFVPLRFLSENLGYTVEWDEPTKTAIITTEKNDFWKSI